MDNKHIAVVANHYLLMVLLLEALETRLGVHATSFGFNEEEEVSNHNPSAILLLVNADKDEGDCSKFLDVYTKKHPTTPIILVTAEGDASMDMLMRDGVSRFDFTYGDDPRRFVGVGTGERIQAQVEACGKCTSRLMEHIRRRLEGQPS